MTVHGSVSLERFLVFPVPVIVDCAEQIPFGLQGITPDFEEDGLDDPYRLRYTFSGLRADAKQKNLPLLVPCKIRSLIWGDYSLEGHETQVAVERKSLHDLYATLGGRRDEFEEEIRALDAYRAAAVMIEANFEAILHRPPIHSRLNPKTVIRTIIAWKQRYPRVSWWPCEDRRMAEVLTFRFLERYYRDLDREADTD